ncbi:unknown [Tannerella sp. CAG:118]|nr:unknown [Tannerella sp. CAG:118]
MRDWIVSVLISIETFTEPLRSTPARYTLRGISIRLFSIEKGISRPFDGECSMGAGTLSIVSIPSLYCVMGRYTDCPG